MTKALFFEREGGFLHRCMFAGLDHNGYAQWVVVDQGTEVLTLRAFQKNFMLKPRDVLLLCIDGERVQSSTMAKLLGAVLKVGDNVAQELPKRIEELRDLGVKWNKEPLKVSARVLEQVDFRNGKKEYSLMLTEIGEGMIVCVHGFRDLKKMFDCVRVYFDALEQQAGIVVEERQLTANAEQLDMMSDRDKELFENY